MTIFISPPTIAGEICYDNPILKRVKFTDLSKDYEAGDIIYEKKCVVSRVFGKHDYLVCYRGVIATKIKDRIPVIGQILIQHPNFPNCVIHDAMVKNMCGIAMSTAKYNIDETGLVAMLICFAGAEAESKEEKHE